MDNQVLPAQPYKKPTSLLILCILTFIGSGVALLGNIQNYLTAGVTKALISKSMEDQAEDSSDTFSVEKNTFIQTADNTKQMAQFGIISPLLTLLGAILMFKRKKVGFGVYVAGTMAAIVVPLGIIGVSHQGLMAVGTGGVVGIIFVALYGLNFKHLR